MKLKVYQLLEESTCEFELIDTIEADTAEECEEIAETKYGSNNNQYHWTNAE